jgi:putative membrane protein
MKKTQIAMFCCAAMVGAAMLIPATGARAQGQAQGPSDSDKTFLAFAAQADQNEIAVSQVAEQKATNPDVKAFAQKVVREHKQMTASMKPFAQKWGITPPMGPDADHQKEIDKLKGMSGADFDKEYMDAMVSDHTAALDKFNTEVNDTKDPAFKKAVTEGKNKVAAHKNMAYDLKKKL